MNWTTAVYSPRSEEAYLEGVILYAEIASALIEQVTYRADEIRLGRMPSNISDSSLLLFCIN